MLLFSKDYPRLLPRVVVTALPHSFFWRGGGGGGNLRKLETSAVSGAGKSFVTQSLVCFVVEKSLRTFSSLSKRLFSSS
jgi:hypothetical protein